VNRLRKLQLRRLEQIGIFWNYPWHVDSVTCQA